MAQNDAAPVFGIRYSGQIRGEEAFLVNEPSYQKPSPFKIK